MSNNSAVHMNVYKYGIKIDMKIFENHNKKTTFQFIFFDFL